MTKKKKVLTDEVVVETPAPFKVVDQTEVQKLQEQKQKIQDIMNLIKEEGLDDDEDFMKEIREAIENF